MISRRKVLAAATLILATTTVGAQSNWPARPIRLVVPFPPGGGTDTQARLLAEKLTAQVGWNVVVDNRPGAGGNIGLDVVAKAAPDGYTIGLGQTSNLAINPSLYPKMSFNPLKDFAPITTFAIQPVVLVANSASAYRSIADVVTASKAKPESVRIGVAGNGTVGHLAGEMLERQAGIKLLGVAYRGAGPAMNDLLGNQVDLNFTSLGSVMPQLAGGRIRALAVSSTERVTAAPQLAAVPTVSESGYPGFDAATWTGLVAPAGTPAALIERLNSEVRKVLARDDVRDKLAQEGSSPLGGTPEAFGRFIRSEHDKWGSLIREANIKLD